MASNYALPLNLISMSYDNHSSPGGSYACLYIRRIKKITKFAIYVPTMTPFATHWISKVVIRTSAPPGIKTIPT